MKIAATVEGGSPKQWFDLTGRALAKAITAGVTGATEGIKQDLRRQLTAAGSKGMARLQGAIRSEVFPKPPRYSPAAAGRVAAHGAEAEKYFTAFSEGPVITPRGKALAVPLHNFRGHDGSLLGPKSAFFAGRIRYIPARARSGTNVGVLAVPATGTASQKRRQRNTAGRKAISRTLADEGLVPVFVLVRTVKLPKLLSPEQTAAVWHDRLPGLIQTAINAMEPN